MARQHELQQLVITLSDTHEVDEILVELEAHGLERCECHRSVGIIIGYLAVTDDYSQVVAHLQQISGVMSVDKSVEMHTLGETTS